MPRDKCTLEIFLNDVAEHEMTVIRDGDDADQFSRHIRFQKPGTVHHYFDIITWRRHLLIGGDMGYWAFQRIEDMFNFFRSPEMEINPDYWAEKLEAVSSGFSEIGAKIFSEEKFRKTVREYFEGYVDSEVATDTKSKIWRRIEQEVLDAENEQDAYQKMREFDHMGFRFEDLHEFNFREYRYHFIWCLYAIVWGVNQYDKEKAGVA